MRLPIARCCVKQQIGKIVEMFNKAGSIVTLHCHHFCHLICPTFTPSPFSLIYLQHEAHLLIPFTRSNENLLM